MFEEDVPRRLLRIDPNSIVGNDSTKVKHLKIIYSTLIDGACTG